MRTRATLLGAAFLALAAFGPLSAQDVGETVTLTGCLVQEDAEEGEEEEVDFHLVFEDEEVGLEAEADVNLGAHAGHTVELTGEVAMEDEEKGAEADEAEEAEKAEDVEEKLHLLVSELRHISASCDEG